MAGSLLFGPAYAYALMACIDQIIGQRFLFRKRDLNKFDRPPILVRLEFTIDCLRRKGYDNGIIQEFEDYWNDLKNDLINTNNLDPQKEYSQYSNAISETAYFEIFQNKLDNIININIDPFKNVRNWNSKLGEIEQRVKSEHPGLGDPISPFWLCNAMWRQLRHDYDEYKKYESHWMVYLSLSTE